jgi:hypothetical protein
VAKAEVDGELKNESAFPSGSRRAPKRGCLQKELPAIITKYEGGMNMAVAKVALSLPTPLLTRIDRMAKKTRLSRSAFVSQAVERSLREPVETEVLRKAYRIYTEVGEEDRALAEIFLPLAAETLPRHSKRKKR